MSLEEKKSFLEKVSCLMPNHFSNDVIHYIACQFALESNFGTSAFACCNHNYCGMKVPGSRITVCYNVTESGKFAVYSCLRDCVTDYLLWLQYNKFTRSEFKDLELFKKHLLYSNYCNDVGYYDKIDTIYNQYYG